MECPAKVNDNGKIVKIDMSWQNETWEARVESGPGHPVCAFSPRRKRNEGTHEKLKNLSGVRVVTAVTQLEYYYSGQILPEINQKESDLRAKKKLAKYSWRQRKKMQARDKNRKIGVEF